MPLARTNMRGWRLKARFGVNGIQWRSIFSSVISMSISVHLPPPAEAVGGAVRVVSAESGPDLRGSRTQARDEFNGAHQRQASRRGLHRDRGDHVVVPVAHRYRDARHAEHVLLVVDRVADADDAAELEPENREV